MIYASSSACLEWHRNPYALSKYVDESKLKLGDLIFWRGHVAMAINKKDIIHANAYHMKTQVEPLKLAKKRINKEYGKIIKICRV